MGNARVFDVVALWRKLAKQKSTSSAEDGLVVGRFLFLSMCPTRWISLLFCCIVATGVSSMVLLFSQRRVSKSRRRSFWTCLDVSSRLPRGATRLNRASLYASPVLFPPQYKQ
ncbi:unnamed protein product [Amoebophrya sp. A25]|nr:unnamed protein product [Amoebophrya sp. A25]|eukprot:GSA25T00023581001.1